MGFINHSRMVVSRAYRETGQRLLEWIKEEALLAIATGVATFVLTPGTNWDRLLIAVAIPLMGLGAWVILLSLWNLCLAPSRLHDAQETTVAGLRAEIIKLEPGVLEMAEEDPRVYIQPLNEQFLSRGFIPFEISNIGQRINPAEGITVHRVPCIPEVSFPYIDLLLSNDKKIIAPVVGDLMAHNNIVAELDKAWRQAWDAVNL